VVVVDKALRWDPEGVSDEAAEFGAEAAVEIAVASCGDDRFHAIDVGVRGFRLSRLSGPRWPSGLGLSESPAAAAATGEVQQDQHRHDHGPQEECGGREQAADRVPHVGAVSSPRIGGTPDGEHEVDDYPNHSNQLCLTLWFCSD
jgi:hypothetical protein